MTTTYRPDGKDQLFVVFYRYAPDAPKSAPEALRTVRQPWLQGLADKRILVGSGPSDNSDVAAISLLRLPDMGTAEKLAGDDPAVREARCVPTLVPWHRMWFEEAAVTRTAFRSQGQQLFVAVFRANPQPAALAMTPAELHHQHRDWLQGLATRDILVGSGPARDENNKNHAGAVMIFRAASLADAEKLVWQEPNAREGQRIPEVWPWRRMWFEE